MIKVKKKCISLGKYEPKDGLYHAFDPNLTLQAYLRPFNPSVAGSLH